MLSQIESGIRNVTFEQLSAIARVTHKDLFELVGVEQGGVPVGGHFLQAGDFLTRADDMGIVGFETNRDAALNHLIPFISSMYAGEICITGSSLRGLQQANFEFVEYLVRAHLQQKIPVKIMFTHPEKGSERENLEGRVQGSILAEIWQGVRWALLTIGVDEQNIRFAKASPTIFSVFAWNGRKGMGLINPYPIQQQGYMTFCVILRSVDNRAERRPGHAQPTPIFEKLMGANFRQPWEDKTEIISVSLQRGIDECLDKPEGRLKSEANEFRKWFDAYKAGQKKDPSIAEAAMEMSPENGGDKKRRAKK